MCLILNRNKNAKTSDILVYSNKKYMFNYQALFGKGARVSSRVGLERLRDKPNGHLDRTTIPRATLEQIYKIRDDQCFGLTDR